MYLYYLKFCITLNFFKNLYFDKIGYLSSFSYRQNYLGNKKNNLYFTDTVKTKL